VNQSLLHIRNADLGYKLGKRKVLVLNVNDLEFFEGDFVGVVGINGAGKSTFLKSISGEIHPLSGAIYFEQKSITDYDLRELSKKLALVLTEKVQGFNLTVFDLVASGQMPYTNMFHQLNENNLQVIEAAMNQIGIKELSSIPLKELSDGNFQKAILAKALAQQTRVLVLDEPGAYLDFGSKHRLFEDLQRLASVEKKCILLSSHDLQLVKKYCTKVLLVYKSKAELLDIQEAVNHPAFLHLGGGYL